NDDRTRCTQLCNDGCIAWCNQLMARKHEATPAVGGNYALDTGVGLDDDRYAPQWTGHKAGPVRFPVFAFCLDQCIFRPDGLDGAIYAVIASDAVQMPLNDLRNLVTV